MPYLSGKPQSRCNQRQPGQPGQYKSQRGIGQHCDGISSQSCALQNGLHSAPRVAGGNPAQGGGSVAHPAVSGFRAEQKLSFAFQHAGDMAWAVVHVQNKPVGFAAAEQCIRQRSADGAAIPLLGPRRGANAIVGGKCQPGVPIERQQPGFAASAGSGGEKNFLLAPQCQIKALFTRRAAQRIGLRGGERLGKAQPVSVRRKGGCQAEQPPYGNCCQQPAQGAQQPRHHDATRTQVSADSGLSAPATTCPLTLPDTATMPSPCATTVTGTRTSTFCCPSSVGCSSIR